MLIESDRESQPSTVDTITYQLRSDKNLDPVAANVLAVLIESAYQEFSAGDRLTSIPKHNPTMAPTLALAINFWCNNLFNRTHKPPVE